MKTKYFEGQDLICIETLAIDIETYGTDFYKDRMYSIDTITCDGIYIYTESGSSVLLTEKEVDKYFKSI